MLSRILLVEDDEDIQLIAQLSLEQLGGFTLASCATGVDALVQVAAFRPDLILLDVNLPQMSGLEILRNLRADPRTAAIPVVFMTAKSAAHELAELRAHGAADVIIKPFDPLTLADTVRAIWARQPRWAG